MKRLLFAGIAIFISISLNSQVNKADVLQRLEKEVPVIQEMTDIATMISASRLFRDKDDLTSVIIIIPKDSVVYVTGSDDTFLRVNFQGNEGYIYRTHAVLSRKPVAAKMNVTDDVARQAAPVRKQTTDRYEYLESKYGRSLAVRLYEHKIWKGMHVDLVRDSWGSPQKLNRYINGDVIKEEWTFNKTILYFQNSLLTDWGPAR